MTDDVSIQSRVQKSSSNLLLQAAFSFTAIGLILPKITATVFFQSCGYCPSTQLPPTSKAVSALIHWPWPTFTGMGHILPSKITAISFQSCCYTVSTHLQNCYSHSLLHVCISCSDFERFGFSHILSNPLVLTSKTTATLPSKAAAVYQHCCHLPKLLQAAFF